ncbi:MAG: Gfo/Idh/MocA family protein [Promethearchaeota archaeon]
MDKVNYGLVGFGGIAENRIAKEGFARDPKMAHRDGGIKNDAVLVAAMDVNPSRKEAVEALGLDWHDDLDLLLDDSRIDAVFISTNNASHFEIARAAIERGKHCIVEKPIATTLQDAKTLKDLAIECGVSLAVDHMMRFNSYNIMARDCIANGDIGNVNDICLHMEFLYGSTQGEANSWRCSKPSELGGPIGDVGSHCFYMAEFLLDDKIIELSCTYTPRTLNIEVENGALIQFKTRSGIQGTCRVAFNQPRGSVQGTLSNLGYEVYGDGGTIRSYGTLFQLSGHDGEPIKIRLERTGTGDELPKRLIPETCNSIYQHMINQHVKSIMDRNYFDGSEAIHNLKLILAAHESARNDSELIQVH